MGGRFVVLFKEKKESATCGYLVVHERLLMKKKRGKKKRVGGNQMKVEYWFQGRKLSKGTRKLKKKNVTPKKKKRPKGAQ